MAKTIYEKIKEAQRAGTFEGTLLAQGKKVRYLNDEYFNSHTLEDLGKELTQEEYEYYHDKVREVSVRESAERETAERKRINDFREKVETDKARYVKMCLDKQARFPHPNRVPESKIKQDITNLVGNPFTGDESYLIKLKEYSGEIEQGNNPDVKVGE